MRALIPALFAAALAPAAYAAPTMQPGLWEITTEVTVPGHPGPIPPMRVEQCFTAEQLAKTEHPLPQMQGCTLDDSRRDGDITRWRMHCDNKQGRMSAQGEIRYGPNAYSGGASFTQTVDGKPMTLTHRYQAKRVGVCPKP